MTTAAASAVLELVAGSQVLPVASFGTETVSLRGSLSAASAKLRHFTLSVANGASRIRVPFNGTVSTRNGEVIIDAADRQLVLSAAAAGLTLDPVRMQALVTSAPVAARPARRKRGQLLALAACVILGAYVAGRLWDKLATIEPRMAYLATEATTLLSPTSGRISFIEGQGTVEAGQPVLGIETTSGKSLLIDAPGDVEIVSGEKHFGDRVKRGDPLLAYAQPDAPLYLHAIVDREQAFRLASGVRVRYARLDTQSDTVVFDVAAEDLAIRALRSDGHSQLYEVRVKVTAVDGEQHRALPVSVRFEQDFGTSLAQSLGAIGLLAGFPATGQGETR
ncbi:MAG TPA: hypothetical protein VIN06_02445 [Devosia sp.]